MVTAVSSVLEPLRGEPRPLPQWASAIARLLQEFYTGRVFDIDLDQTTELYTLQALEQLREGLLVQQQIPLEIAPHLSAAETIRQLLAQVQSGQLPAPRQDGPIELLGWLELPLDASPALIVTALNEGNVPTSVNSDLFLPNSLRQQLDLVDNRRRYARDAYALSALQASREQLTLIAGRFTADHDPLSPSRLALATDLPTMAERAIAFFSSQDPEQSVHGVIQTIGRRRWLVEHYRPQTAPPDRTDHVYQHHVVSHLSGMPIPVLLAPRPALAGVGRHGRGTGPSGIWELAA